MKDRIEFRFTVATATMESKELKVVSKLLEPFTKRILEATTKLVEHQVNEEMKKGEKE